VDEVGFATSHGSLLPGGLAKDYALRAPGNVSIRPRFLGDRLSVDHSRYLIVMPAGDLERAG
jgi:hypothetical protein